MQIEWAEHLHRHVFISAFLFATDFHFNISWSLYDFRFFCILFHSVDSTSSVVIVVVAPRSQWSLVHFHVGTFIWWCYILIIFPPVYVHAFVCVRVWKAHHGNKMMQHSRLQWLNQQKIMYSPVYYISVSFTCSDLLHSAVLNNILTHFLLFVEKCSNIVLQTEIMLYYYMCVCISIENTRCAQRDVERVAAAAAAVY